MECLKTSISHSICIFETKHLSTKITLISKKKLAEIHLDKYAHELHEYSSQLFNGIYNPFSTLTLF